MFLLCYRSVTEGTPPFINLKKPCMITQLDAQKGFRNLVQIPALSLTSCVTLDKSTYAFSVSTSPTPISQVYCETFSVYVWKDQRDTQEHSTLHRLQALLWMGLFISSEYQEEKWKKDLYIIWSSGSCLSPRHIQNITEIAIMKPLLPAAKEQPQHTG